MVSMFQYHLMKVMTVMRLIYMSQSLVLGRYVYAMNSIREYYLFESYHLIHLGITLCKQLHPQPFSCVHVYKLNGQSYKKSDVLTCLRIIKFTQPQLPVSVTLYFTQSFILYHSSGYTAQPFLKPLLEHSLLLTCFICLRGGRGGYGWQTFFRAFINSELGLPEVASCLA